MYYTCTSWHYPNMSMFIFMNDIQNQTPWKKTLVHEFIPTKRISCLLLTSTRRRDEETGFHCNSVVKYSRRLEHVAELPPVLELLLSPHSTVQGLGLSPQCTAVVISLYWISLIRTDQHQHKVFNWSVINVLQSSFTRINRKCTV